MKVTFTFRWGLLMLLVGFLLFPALASAQNVVTGTVIDDLGEPIIGATVLEKGTTNGVVTDIDGNFSLMMNSTKNPLVFSFVGMVSQEHAATPGKPMNITLAEDNQVLDDVVVVGYGSKARRDLTGSVGSISGAKLAVVPVASAGEALAGKIAGVQVTTVDGQPGADINIRVRGGTSLNADAKPLFIVDGFQTDNINDIPPTDIQSIDVLKDASLTAIYGARGGNGVVVVTTKSASEGKVKIDLNISAQISKIANKIDMLDSYEYVLYQRDFAHGNNSRIYQFRHDFGNEQDLDIYQTLGSHDWQDEIMRTPLTTQYNLTLTGGSDKVKFSTSITHSDQNGVIEGSGVRRTNVNTKLNVQLTKKVKFTFNPRLTFRRDLGAGGEGIGTNGLVGVLRWRPTNGLRDYIYRDDATVNYADETPWLVTTPKEDMDQNYQLKHSYTFTNQASIDWNIIKNLTFRSDVSQYWQFYDLSRFYGELTNNGINNNNMPLAQLTNSRTDKFTWTNTLSYNLEVGNNHNYSFLLGQEIQSSQRRQDFQSSRYFPQGTDPRKAFNNMGLGSAYQSTSTLTTPNRMSSFFAQVSYNYDHKYLLSGTFRADGSSKFAPGNQWGYFPAISGAWVVSREKWWDVSQVSNFKVRAAFGLTGNNAIGDDLWRYQYAIQSEGGPSWGELTERGETYYRNSSNTTFPNSDIKWETTVTRNLAVDLGLFKDRVTVTPELYWNTTKDMLYQAYIPTATGYTMQWQNVGQITNKGFELTVQGTIAQGKHYNVMGTLTLGHNKSKVDKLNGETTEFWTTSNRWKSDDNDFCLKVGDEVGLIYGYEYDGLYQFDEFNHSVNNYSYTLNEGVVDNTIFTPQPGTIKLKDRNGDGTVNEDDRTIIGNTNPVLQGGFGFSSEIQTKHGNWDMSVNFTYFLGFDVLNATAYDLSSSKNNSGKFYNVSADFAYDKRFTYIGDVYNQNADGTMSLYNKFEELVGNSQHPEYLAQYEELNAGKTKWNPATVTKNYTLSNFVEDGSMLRIQDVTVGYTLPDKLTKKCAIQRLRVYFTGSNLYNFTKYSGYDPEVDVQNGLTPSVDYNRYPRSRGYLLGLNVTF